jgi:hypothetical protein
VDAREATQQGRHATNRADLIVEIGEGHISLRRAVEFDDARNREAVLKGLPDFRTQSIADTDADLMALLVGMRGAVLEVATELSDVLERGHVVAGAVFPESTGRELSRENGRRAGEQRRTEGHRTARRMIEGQHDVHAIGGIQIAEGDAAARP